MAKSLHPDVCKKYIHNDTVMYIFIIVLFSRIDELPPLNTKPKKCAPIMFSITVFVDQILLDTHWTTSYVSETPVSFICCLLGHCGGRRELVVVCHI